MKQIKFICRTCEDTNKHRAGEPNYQVRLTEFDSLTEAMSHVFDGHHVEAFVEDDEDEQHSSM